MSKFQRIVFATNIIFAFLLVLALPSGHISSAKVPFFAFLALLVPTLVVINIAFLFFWVLFRKMHLLLSLSTLVLSYFLLGPFIKWSKNSKENGDGNDLRIMSFNSRSFDRWAEYDGEYVIGDEIVAFVKSQSPDIVCFQEFYHRYLEEFEEDYPYQYMSYEPQFTKSILVTLSKYPLLNCQSMRFPNTGNNGAYCDVLFAKDTLRVYNLHMQSAQVIPTAEAISNEPSSRLFKRLSYTFKRQQEQAELVRDHRIKNSYGQIICGDFNNNQFSSSYHTVIGDDFQDTFLERGNGFGRTYSLFGIPQRIDFILADNTFEVIDHQNFDIELSDHYPIMATLELKAE